MGQSYVWEQIAICDALDCLRCGHQPSMWLLYLYSPSDDTQFSGCWWYCNNCRPVIVRDMVSGGPVPDLDYRDTQNVKVLVPR